MDANNNWVITQMEVKPKEEKLVDVVIFVHWKRNASLIYGDKTYYSAIYGTMSCEKPSETDFTAYSNLTFEQVCEWLEAGLDVSELDATLDVQLKNQVNPPIITLPLPFKNPAN
jgi:hypothetical protein